MVIRSVLIKIKLGIHFVLGKDFIFKYFALLKNFYFHIFPSARDLSSRRQIFGQEIEILDFNATTKFVWVNWI